MVLGAVEPEQAEYATAMSQLIVSVLTIVSIGFAFFEFLRSSRSHEGKDAQVRGESIEEEEAA